MKNALLFLCFITLFVNPTYAETIAQLKALYNGTDVVIPAGWQISGVVISDATSNNNDPKNLIVQDATAGIVIRFGVNHNLLVNDRVTADIGGLVLTSYNGLMEVLNTPRLSVTKTGIGSITARTVSIAQLLANSYLWQSTLVKIPCAVISGGGGNYSGIITLTDATGSINLYTRSAASFASTPFTTDTVNLVGAVGVFGVPQLQIRTTADVQSGCIAYTPPVPVNHSIAELRALYNGSDATVPDNWQITGVVISDRAHQNIDNDRLILQDSTAGILVDFTSAHSFAEGDVLTILAEGRPVSSNSGWLQLGQAEVSGAYVTASSGVVPRIASIREIIANGQNWQSTLVQVPCAVITSTTAAYLGTVTLTDVTGSIALYTQQGATFASSAFPTDSVHITAILGNFAGEQLLIRDEPDVVLGCNPYNYGPLAVEELLPDGITAKTKYYDVTGRQITQEQCSICIAITGNKARRVAVVK